jgi:SAM-dependent methyltransferase
MRDWEKCYQAGETPWDHGSAAPPLLEVIERHGVALWGGGPVLVPGCGLGHDVRALAALGLPVLGLDIAETAVALASGITAVGGETYACGDFLDPAWRVGREFSAVWEHTCFCAINPALRQAYAEATAALLDAGQVLIGVFYLTPEMASDETGPPFKVSIEELEEIFGPWFERIDGWVPERAYPSRVGREWVGIFRRR